MVFPLNNEKIINETDQKHIRELLANTVGSSFVIIFDLPVFLSF